MIFLLPATLIPARSSGRRPRTQAAELSIEAEDREDARFLVHHGVVEATIAQTHPGAKVKYNLRRMRAQREAA